MAASDVSICNLALQKLGAARITALTDDSRNARSVNACYAQLRDEEIEAHRWNFAKKRVILAPDSVTPPFGFLYQFSFPSDLFTLLLPARYGVDWKIEGRKILTNESNTLNVRYIGQITDPTQFPNMFVEALACKVAWHCCEEITQSNDKKAAVQGEYKDAIRAARRNNAFQSSAEDPPEDSWQIAQRIASGSLNFIRSTWDTNI